MGLPQKLVSVKAVVLGDWNMG